MEFTLLFLVCQFLQPISKPAQQLRRVAISAAHLKACTATLLCSMRASHVFRNTNTTTEGIEQPGCSIAHGDAIPGKFCSPHRMHVPASIVTTRPNMESEQAMIEISDKLRA